MKKPLALFLAAILSLGMLTGCGDKASVQTGAEGDSVVPAEASTDNDSVDSKTSTEKIPVRFMYWNKQDSMQALLDLIEKELPNVDFQFEFVDVASFPTVYKTQMNAGEGPDILAVEYAPTEVQAGWILDISDQPFVANYQESVINELAVDGKTYVIPGPSWFGGYFYNKQMFEDNGWQIPATYDEWIELCGKIADTGIKPLANPIKNPNFLMHYALSYVTGEFLRQPEGMSWDKDYAAGRVTMAESWGPYLETWSEVVKQGYVTAEDLGMDYDQALDEFVTGKAAMFDSGPWDVDAIYGKNPDMKIDMMPYVGNKGDTGWLFGGPGVRFGLNSKLGESGNEEKLAAALSVLELISSPEGQKAYWENNKGGSSYVKGVTFEMPAEYDGCKQVFAEGHIYAPWTQWNAGVYDEFGKQLQGYVAGDTTLQQVMEATDAKNEEVRSKFE